MTMLQGGLILAAFVFLLIGLFCLRIGNTYAYSVISFVFSFVSVVLAIWNPFSTPNTVIIERGPVNEPSGQDTKSVDDVCSPDENYFFTYNGHTYCFYDVHTIDVNKYGNVTDASKGAYKNVQQFCEDQGGHLAIIGSWEENEKLFDETQERYDHTVFFGLSDENKEDRWVWVDGHENTLELWAFKSGYQQPDNGHGYTKEHYAEFDYDRYNPEGSDNTGKWNDAVYLKNTSIFICEWDFILEGL